MTSSRERQQRAAARARLARQMADRQAAAKHRRQQRLTIGAAIAAVVVLAGTIWGVIAFTKDDPAPTTPAALDTPSASPTPTAPAPPGECVWHASPDGANVVDVGLPPEGEPREGTQMLTVTTNRGEIKVQMDLSAAPCIAASFSHLAGQEFYDGTKCHRMFPGMLQCGDPTARGEGYRSTDGSGGPGYRFPDQNLPTEREPSWYPAGVMAMANSGEDTNGSQFFFIYQNTDLDGPNYSVVGEIFEGMDVLAQIDAIGHDGAFEPAPGGGHPNEDIIIESVRVSEPILPSPTPEPSAAATEAPADDA